MKILITGAAGFLGSSISKKFSAMGHEVVGCGRGNLTKDNQAEIGLHKWFSGVITANFLEELNYSPDVIVHCAGSGSVIRSEESPLESYRDTVTCTEVILEFLRLRNPGAILIYPSSPAVIGASLNEALKISTSTFPISIYGIHKLIAENLCENFRRSYNLKIKVIRLFSVYGPGLRKQLLWDACKKFERQKLSEFWGDGNETRDFIHIDDVANLFYLVANQNSDHLPNKMNCGSGESRRIFDILNILKGHFDEGQTIKFNGKRRDGDPRYFWADNSEAHSYMWQPKINLEAGLYQYVNWFKSLNIN